MGDSLPSPQLWHGFAAGGISGIISRLVVYPFDTIKARLQVQGYGGSTKSLPSNATRALYRVLAQEGMVKLYYGFGVVVVGVVPGNMMYFGGYEMGKAMLPDELGFVRNLGSGVCAQILGGIVFTPMDLLKERMQVGPMMEKDFGANSRFWNLVKSRGVLGLMRGYWVTNSVWIPWSAIYAAMYGTSLSQFPYAINHAHKMLHGIGLAKNSLSLEAEENGFGYQGGRDARDVPYWGHALCAAFAASFACVVTHPLDVIKTQLQVLTGTREGKNLRTSQIVESIWRAEGLKGFTRGLGARIANLAPGTALSWMIYESAKKKLERA